VPSRRCLRRDLNFLYVLGGQRSSSGGSLSRTAVAALPQRSIVRCTTLDVNLQTTSLPYANLSPPQSVDTARKTHFEGERQGL
jgi:hypothetical protein